MHVLPSAVHAAVGIGPSSAAAAAALAQVPDAATAVAKIEAALEETALGSELCALVDAAQEAAANGGSGCTTQVLAKGRLLPLMDRATGSSPKVVDVAASDSAAKSGTGTGAAPEDEEKILLGGLRRLEPKTWSSLREGL